MESTNRNKKPRYLDPSQPIEKRFEELISRMTIEEKVAQLGSISSFSLTKSGNLSLEIMEKRLKNGMGQITRVGGLLIVSPEESAN